MTAERVARPVGDEAYVVVELDLGAGEEAAGFLRLLEAQGWSSRDRVPALAGPPLHPAVRGRPVTGAPPV